MSPKRPSGNNCFHNYIILLQVQGVGRTDPGQEGSPGRRQEILADRCFQNNRGYSVCYHPPSRYIQRNIRIFWIDFTFFSRGGRLDIFFSPYPVIPCNRILDIRPDIYIKKLTLEIFLQRSYGDFPIFAHPLCFFLKGGALRVRSANAHVQHTQNVR